MKTSQTLAAAKLKLIKQGWIQNSYAQDTKGNELAPTRLDTTCFCSLGALINTITIDKNLVSELDTFTIVMESANYKLAAYYLSVAITHSYSIIHTMSETTEAIVANYNDDTNTTLADVCYIFDHAIELAKQNGD